MNKEQIKKTLSEAIKNSKLRDSVEKASLFGSYVRGEESSESDIDVLIEFKPDANIGLFEFVRLQRFLGESMGRKVDLLTPESISKFFREKVLNEAEIIYER
ncbi:MAG: nucleotidyltransferase family protein [Candidatus Brennerbacteria bacterium]|nr:nucleotidyltransferase family protein [Candidatus Brennerbacteria bacterium]